MPTNLCHERLAQAGRELVSSNPPKPSSFLSCGREHPPPRGAAGATKRCNRASGILQMENATMRITKKTLREAKTNASKRIKELCLMSLDEIRATVKRGWPIITFTEDRPGELLWFLISDVLDIALPDHWIQ